MKTTYLYPPAVIKIPENVTVKDDLVYLGEFVVGYIDLGTPEGMMNIPAPMVLMME